MNPSRRDFAAALLASVPVFGQDPAGSQLGNLYPPIQAMADASPLELSFLRPEFRDHRRWQRLAREKLFDLLHLPACIHLTPSSAACSEGAFGLY